MQLFTDKLLHILNISITFASLVPEADLHYL